MNSINRQAAIRGLGVTEEIFSLLEQRGHIRGSAGKYDAMELSTFRRSPAFAEALQSVSRETQLYRQFKYKVSNIYTTKPDRRKAEIDRIAAEMRITEYDYQ